MAINKATIVKEVDGRIEYIYPKTTSDIVEYTTDVSVKDKLDELVDTKAEVTAARVAKSDNIVKSSLKARIDADFTAINDGISSTVNDAMVDFQGRLDDAVEQFEQSTDAVLQAANGKNKVFHQSTAPAASAGLTVGDTWFDTDDDYTMYRWDGTQWVKEQFDENAIANGAISNIKIKDATIEDAKIKWLDAGKLTAGYIDSNRIKVNELLSQNITATGTITGMTIDGGTIRGANLDIGSATQYIKYNSSTGNLDIKVNELTIGNSTAATTAQVSSAAGTAKNEAIAAAASTADDKIAAARQGIIDAAVASANSYTDTAVGGIESGSGSKTISDTTPLYFTKSTTSPIPAAPTAHVTSNSTGAGVWTTEIPVYNTSYKYYFTCVEYLYSDNTYGWSPVTYNAELSTAVEDSYILNEISTIQAGEVKVKNGALYVDKEFVSSLFGYEITVPTGGCIKGPTIISNNYNGTVTSGSSGKSYAINNTTGSILQLNDGTFNFANKLKWDGTNLTIAANSITIGGVNAATTSNVTAAKNEAIAAAAQDADDKISDLQTELNGNITAAIEAAQLNSDKTITSATVLYYLSNSNVNTPTVPNAHVTSVSTGTGTWTTKVPTCTNTYKYYYNCTEYLYDDDSYGWSAVTYNAELSMAAIDSYILNNLTNIGDGEVKIQNGALYVDTQFVNSLFARDITVPSGGSINGGVIKSLNYGSLSDITKDYSNTVGSIINLNNGTLNLGGGSMVFDGTTLNIKSGIIGGFQIGFENNAYLMRAEVDDDDGTRHQYFFQAATRTAGGSTSNAFAIRERALNESTWTYPFRVRYDGFLHATKGSIAGWNLTSYNIDDPDASGILGSTTLVEDTTDGNTYQYWTFIQAPDPSGNHSNGKKTTACFSIRRRTYDSSTDTYGSWENLFNVNYKGNALVTGTINSEAGKIGNWKIEDNLIRAGFTKSNLYYQAYMQAPEDSSTANVFAVRSRPSSSTSVDDYTLLYRVRYDGRTRIGGTNFAEAYTDEQDFFVFRCQTESSTNNITNSYCGTPSRRWKYVYSETLYGTVSTSSDKKLKDHIEYLVNDEHLDEFFYGLKPVMYTLKDGNAKRHHMGLYAQDVSKLAQDTIGDIAAYQASIINHDGDDPDSYKSVEDEYFDPEIDDSKLTWSLRYDEFIAPTIAIVQKQHARITTLERENAELKDRLASIEERLAALEA